MPQASTGSLGPAAGFRGLLRRRLPFGGLLLSAVIGIVAAHAAPLPLPVFFAIFFVFAIAATTARGRFAIWPATLCAFAALTLLNGPLSPGTHLAATLTDTWQVTRNAEFRIATAPTGSGETWRFRGQLFQPDSSIRIPIQVRWKGPEPAYGQIWRLDGSMRNLPGPRNPGEFDYAAYLWTFGIKSELRLRAPDDATPIRIEANPITSLAITARRWIERTLTLGIADTPEAAIIRAMTVGDTSGIPAATEDEFRQIGVFHLFSVSGLHVGLIALILWGALTMTPLGSRRAVWILIPAIFFYALLTGWKPASVRAATMISLVAAGLVLDRRAFALNSVAAAAFIILLVNPRELLNPGFQLSFGVVLTILVIANPTRQWLDRIAQPDPFIPRSLLNRGQLASASSARYIAALAGVSLAAWLGSLPLILHYFHLVSVVAIPVNLFAVPAAGAILALSLLSLTVGVVSPWLAAIFNNTNLLFAKSLTAFIHGAASLPGSHFYVAPPNPPGTIAVITVLDCGAGGSTVLECGNKIWLIDAGSKYDGENIVRPFLRFRGINSISTAVFTHGDSRHLGGFNALLDAPPIRRVIDSPLPDRSSTRSALLTELHHRGIPVRSAGPQETFPLDDHAHVEILHPPADSVRTRVDDKTLVLRVTVDGFSALLLSDSGWATEFWLLENASDRLDCDVLIKGHHFSGRSGSAEFLAATSPDAIIVTGASFPPHEQIHPDFAAEAAQKNITIYRQDVKGAVTIDVRPTTFGITPFLEPLPSIRE